MEEKKNSDQNVVTAHRCLVRSPLKHQLGVGSNAVAVQLCLLTWHEMICHTVPVEGIWLQLLCSTELQIVVAADESQLLALTEAVDTFPRQQQHLSLWLCTGFHFRIRTEDPLNLNCFSTSINPTSSFFFFLRLKDFPSLLLGIGFCNTFVAFMLCGASCAPVKLTLSQLKVAGEWSCFFGVIPWLLHCDTGAPAGLLRAFDASTSTTLVP